MANAIARDFGSVSRWRQEFIALAEGTRGRLRLGAADLCAARRAADQPQRHGSRPDIWRAASRSWRSTCTSMPITWTSAPTPPPTSRRSCATSIGMRSQTRYRNATKVAPPPRLEQKQWPDLPSITVEEVKSMLDAGQPVQIIDTRPRHYSTRAQDIMEGATWRDPERVDEWIGELSKTDPVVTFCVYGFHIGCETAETLRKAGFDARYMAGGHYAWKAIKGAGEAVRMIVSSALNRKETCHAYRTCCHACRNSVLGCAGACGSPGLEQGRSGARPIRRGDAGRRASLRLPALRSACDGRWRDAAAGLCPWRLARVQGRRRRRDGDGRSRADRG